MTIAAIPSTDAPARPEIEFRAMRRDDLPEASAMFARVMGMIGVETRRLRLDDRVVRVASAGFLAVVPQARSSATGVLLLRRLLGGPQDLTVTDTASELVEKIWLRLGGNRV